MYKNRYKSYINHTYINRTYIINSYTYKSYIYMYVCMYVEVLWMLGKEGSLQPTCYHFFESKTPLQAVVSRACKNHGVSRCRLRSGQWVLASIVHVERTQNEVIVQHGRLFAPLVTPSLVYHEKTMNKLDIFR